MQADDWQRSVKINAVTSTGTTSHQTGVPFSSDQMALMRWLRQNPDGYRVLMEAPPMPEQWKLPMLQINRFCHLHFNIMQSSYGGAQAKNLASLLPAATAWRGKSAISILRQQPFTKYRLRGFCTEQYTCEYQVFTFGAEYILTGSGFGKDASFTFLPKGNTNATAGKLKKHGLGCGRESFICSACSVEVLRIKCLVIDALRREMISIKDSM